MGIKDFLDPVAAVWMVLVVMALRGLLKRKPGAWKYVIVLLLVPVMEVCRVPARLLASLEAPYRNSDDPAATISGCDAVIICGGMLQASPDDFSGADYSESVDRFLTGVDMARRLHCPLVLGGGQSAVEPESAFLKRWLAAWNITGLDVSDLGACRDTRDEAAAAAVMAKGRGWKKVLLVTSAWHLPRATAVFRHAGLAVTPYGCDFQGTTALQGRPAKFLPSGGSASLWRCWITEVVGRLYYRCRGWS